jgi:sarcosine oxidase subunit gamma
VSEILRPRSALAEVYRVGRVGAEPPEGAGVTLCEHRPRAIVHLAGRAVNAAVRAVVGLDLPVVPNAAAGGGDVAILSLAPQRWLIVSDRHHARELETGLGPALGDGAGVLNEVTGGRTVIRIGGPRARELLAKGCPLDLHPAVFGDGRCAQSVIGPINVLLHATDGGRRLDLYVARSLAAWLWEGLSRGAAEFGYQVLPASAA